MHAVQVQAHRRREDGRAARAQGDGGQVRSIFTATLTSQVQGPAQPHLRRRQLDAAVVSSTELRVRDRMPRPGQGARHDHPDGQVRVRPRLLLRLRPARSPAVHLPARQALAQEVRRRFGDGQLDLGQHQGVPEVHGHDREERRLQCACERLRCLEEDRVRSSSWLTRARST